MSSNSTMPISINSLLDSLNSLHLSDFEPYLPYVVALVGAASLTFAISTQASTHKQKSDRYSRYHRKLKKLLKATEQQIQDVEKSLKKLQTGELTKVNIVVEKLVNGEFDGKMVDMDGTEIHDSILTDPNHADSEKETNEQTDAKSPKSEKLKSSSHTSASPSPSSSSSRLVLPLTPERLKRRLKGLEEMLLKLVMKCDNIKLNSLISEFAHKNPPPSYRSSSSSSRKSGSRKGNDAVEIDLEETLRQYLKDEDRLAIETTVEDFKIKKKEVVKTILADIQRVDDWIHSVKDDV
ncbi:hypothetical protein BKA69DRAFT_928321 [Paraphysoderma sedebokerense]|nr:hypothetical protein BKA69DRAFT_928321 [Paraphysoderma sedebokerense]